MFTLPLNAEFKTATTREEALEQLDAFRETVRPSSDYDLTLTITSSESRSTFWQLWAIGDIMGIDGHTFKYTSTIFTSQTIAEERIRGFRELIQKTNDLSDEAAAAIQITAKPLEVVA